jgi:c-di-GMP-binding flagellar brake protein YcgR
MFEGTASWWRRLTKGQSDAGPSGTAATHEERRIWVRHPCDLQTQYAPDADEPPLSAQVVDISCGGAKVIVGRAHEPGSLISIELPGPDGKTACAALACVVHQRQLSAAEWVLGCNFSKELEEEHLRAFGFDKGTSASSDKRTWQRFAANVTASVQLTNSNDLTRWPAKVLNLSPGGVALVVERDIRNGTLLTANLCGATGQTVETILICVVHITTLDDGTRRLGCNFIRELEESHLRQLLA